jgi:Transposase DDE domain
VAPLLDQIDVRIAKVTADGAYDDTPIYATIEAHGDDIEVVISPRSTPVTNDEQGPFAQRDRHLEMITERGRLAWPKATDYGKRSLVETTMGRYKALIGPRLRAPASLHSRSGSGSLRAQSCMCNARLDRSVNPSRWGPAKINLRADSHHRLTAARLAPAG